MRDYGNMPVLRWDGESSARKAMAQVQHAEPVVLQMPEDFVMAFDAPACGCKEGATPDRHVDCHAEETLKALAERNAMPELARLGELAHEAGQVVDVLGDSRRIVIHD